MRKPPYPFDVPGASISQTFAEHGGVAVDIAVPSGTPFPAPRDGMVVLATGWMGPRDVTDGRSLGYAIMMYDAGADETWLYGHGNGTYHVKPGDFCGTRAPVFDTDNSGYSRGPHNHIERWRGRGFPKGEFIDPFAGVTVGGSSPSSSSPESSEGSPRG